MTTAEGDFRRAVLAVVRRIPRGKVSTYGEVAALAGSPGAARGVGGILSRLSGPLGTKIPWQRVVNSSGGISRRPGEGPDLQRALLEREGVAFGRGGKVDLLRHRWQPTGAPASRGRRKTVRRPRPGATL